MGECSAENSEMYCTAAKQSTTVRWDMGGGGHWGTGGVW